MSSKNIIKEPMPKDSSSTSTPAAEDASNNTITSSSKTRESTGTNDSKLQINKSQGTCMIIYNVSHSDMIFGFDPEINTSTISASLGSPRSPSTRTNILKLAKPKFSVYSSMSQTIYKQIRDKPYELVINRTKQGNMIPIGLELNSEDSIGKFEDFHCASAWRSSSICPQPGDDAKPKHIYFPLVSKVIYKWMKQVDITKPYSKKIIYLITGSGAPRNPEHSYSGNSTECTAKLISIYLKAYYNVEVILLHSGAGIFRFDDNVNFVNHQLRPVVEEERRNISKLFPDEDWVNHLDVSIALTDGAAARVSSINAGLREYRPDFLHLWELKSFWYYGLIDENDVDYIAFEAVEMSPSINKKNLECEERLLVEEMVLHKTQFEQIRDSNTETELAKFWLRKSRKLVLSVLMVKKDGTEDPPIFYRGTNMEVSMPTGSLCSERNVIGTALAADLTLHRREIKMVCVLSVRLGKTSPPLASPSPSITSPLPGSFTLPASKLARISSISADVHQGLSLNTPPSFPASSLRKYSTHSTRSSTTSSPRVKHRGGAGLNPTSPCGACNEWLKKIAEVNPDFRVVTFTDETCDFVFINHIT